MRGADSGGRARFAVWAIAAVVATFFVVLFNQAGRGHVRLDEGTDEMDEALAVDPFRLENARPVIGILTQPDPFGVEYLAASYVKYAEAAGARVVPLRYGWSEQKLKQVMLGLNGILFPGGGATIDPKTSKIYRAASILFTEAERLNKLGRRFPVWGTCLGWELLATLSSSYNILTDSGSFKHPGVSSFIEAVNKKSKMFKDLRPLLYARVEFGQKLFYYSHEFGVTPDMFNKSLDTKCWKIVALGKDLNGKAFVAAAENSCHPYYGVQFHPEKSLFEWYSKVDIPHAQAATDVSRHFISLLSKELRHSRSASVKDSWVFENDIHHVKIVTEGNSYFYQRYIFSNSSEKVTDESDGVLESADAQSA